MQADAGYDWRPEKHVDMARDCSKADLHVPFLYRHLGFH